jgi:hypothetical protein
MMIKVAEIPAVSGDQDLGLLGHGGSEDGNILAGQSVSFPAGDTSRK